MPPQAIQRRRRAGTLLLTLVAIALLTPLTAPVAAAETTSWLPFDLPSQSVLRSSPHKVFANWVSTLPVSLDNQEPETDYYQRNYLTPTGEGGKHAAYGGFLRDRPLPRAPLATPDWRLEDMKSEVRQAIEAGIDGFTVVIYTFPAPGDSSNQAWTNTRLMMEAAGAVDPGFKIIPMPDMSGPLSSTDVASMSSRMAELGQFSSAYRIDGKLVMSPFTAELRSVSWWTSVISTMTNTHHTPVAFFPTFQDEQTHGAAFAPITYGMANWGVRDPTWNDPDNPYPTGPVGRIDKVHALGDRWMQPISVQDVRPREGRYFEPGNTENLRNTWEIARKAGADWAQLVTWNDLPEGSGMQPSAKHSYSFLDINAYYISWFKTGTRPTITRDAIYLTHRTQKLAAPVTFPQSKWMTNLDGGTKGRDTVEALTFSKAPSTVELVVGGQTYSCDVDAGVDTCTVPLNTGKVRAKLVRDGAAVATLASPYEVRSNPYVQDFEYVGSGNLRQGTSSPSTAGGAAGSTVSLSPTEDGFAESAHPSANHGGGASLVVDGSPDKEAYLRFSLPTAPAGKTLTKAVLEVNTTSDSFAGSPSTYAIGVAENGWTESTLTWDNRPSVPSGPLGSLFANSPNSSYSSTLSVSHLQGSLGKEISLAVVGEWVNGVFLISSNSPDVTKRPQMVLTFS